MPKLVWYRSLYWRIALGFVALLATVLVVQGFIFLWMTDVMTDLFPTRSPAQLAAAIATDVAATVSDHPDTNLESYLNSKYSRSSRGFVVVLSDGRVIQSQHVPAPPGLERAARGRLYEDRNPNPNPNADWRNRPRPGQGSDQGGGFGPRAPVGRDLYGPSFRGPGGANVEFAQVAVDGAPVGEVAVPREPPPLTVVLRDVGPTMALIALGLLVFGTATAALVIFRPASRRLSKLQEAARALGAGEIGVRAPESGGDEVTALARAFNDMAARLERRTQALENADRTRRQLLADVSHELTTPLAAIRGYVETLSMSGLPLDMAARTRYLGIVYDETERLEHIVGDLLDLARLEGGGGSLKIEDVSVAQLLERIEHRHEPLLRDKRVKLVTVRAPNAINLRGDQNRLEQALQNLVANAVRHTPEGGTVTVKASAPPGQVVFSIEDTGPGIPPEHLPRIFDRFYKVDEARSGTALPSGSGLGLSIVQAIVARHGGIVRAANLPTGGACFEVTLPAAGPATASPPLEGQDDAA